MGYVIRKFVRRNRGKVIATSLLFLSLAAGAIVSTGFAIQRDRALADYEKLLIGAELEQLERRAAEAHPPWPEQEE